MNTRHRLPGIRMQYPDISSAVILSACFLVGICSGCLLASFFKQGSDPHLFSYLDEYFSVLERGGKTGGAFLSTVWELFRWPLFAALVGSTLFGVVALPALLCLRGFLLSYATSVLIGFYGGWHGLLLALCIFGAPAFSSVAILFSIGRTVLRRHISGPKGKERNVQLRSILLSGLAWIAAGIFLQHWICPALLRRIVVLL